MLLQLKADTTMVLLDAIDIDRVDLGTIVGEKSGEGTADDFGAIDDGDNSSVEAVTVGKYSVIDSDIFHDLDQSEGGAGDDTLLGLGLVEKADVVVHVVDVLVVQALDILADIDDVLEVLILHGS